MLLKIYGIKYGISHICQVIHRTLAALLAAFVSIGTLAALQDRPTMDEMIKWIDYETLLLIFSMMILVAILIDTGIFDYISVYTFQVSIVSHQKSHTADANQF